MPNGLGSVENGHTADDNAGGKNPGVIGQGGRLCSWTSSRCCPCRVGEQAQPMVRSEDRRGGTPAPTVAQPAATGPVVPGWVVIGCRHRGRGRANNVNVDDHNCALPPGRSG